MMIETFTNVPVPQDVDIRIKKKDEGEDLRPIEGSGKGNGPELDFNREETSDVRIADRKKESDDIGKDMYGAEGKLLKENRVEREVDTGPGNIDITV